MHAPSNLPTAPFTAKDHMKKPAATTEKKVREPMVECHQTNYSEAALQIMEQIMGTRYARSTPKPIKPPVAATDAD